MGCQKLHKTTKCNVYCARQTVHLAKRQTSRTHVTGVSKKTLTIIPGYSVDMKQQTKKTATAIPATKALS
jgi:hypothetical protein